MYEHIDPTSGVRTLINVLQVQYVHMSVGEYINVAFADDNVQSLYCGTIDAAQEAFSALKTLSVAYLPAPAS